MNEFEKRQAARKSLAALFEDLADSDLFDYAIIYTTDNATPDDERAITNIMLGTLLDKATQYRSEADGQSAPERPFQFGVNGKE